MLIGSSKFELIIQSTDRKYFVYGMLGDPSSDVLSINVNKQLGQPFGTFEIIFTVKPDKEGKTWFDKLGLYDLVTISFKGIKDERLNVIMRGLITDIRLTETYGGSPIRTVSIVGKDLGCLLSDFQIYAIPELSQEEAFKKLFGGPILWEAIKKQILFGTLKELFDFILDVWRQQIDLEIADGISVLDFIRSDVEMILDGLKTTAFYLSGYEGNWWNVFTHYQDKPFHEIIMYDYDEYSWLVIRPSRLKDKNGKYVDKVNSLVESKKYMYPSDINITNEEILSVSIGKNVNDVFTFYMVVPALLMLSKVEFRSFAVSHQYGTPIEQFVNPYFAVSPDSPSFLRRFGFKPFEAEFSYIDLDFGQTSDMQQGASENAREYDNWLIGNFKGLGETLNKILVGWYEDAPRMLSGNFTIGGTNRVRIGTYMKDESGWEYYVESVSHEFTVMESYTTSLGVTRGRKVS